MTGCEGMCECIRRKPESHPRDRFPSGSQPEG